MKPDPRIVLRMRAKELLDIRRGLDLKLKHLGDQRYEVMEELRRIEAEILNATPLSEIPIYIGGGRG